MDCIVHERQGVTANMPANLAIGTLYFAIRQKTLTVLQRKTKTLATDGAERDQAAKHFESEGKMGEEGEGCDVI